ncbi:MAG: N-acetylmuramoyl-L-alanine amidase [Ferruginibacter sp.]
MNFKKTRNHFLQAKYTLLFSSILFFITASAQVAEKPFIKLTNPDKEKNNTTSSQQFIIGSTCKSCNLMINGEKIKVYPTGAFAYEIRLKEGDNVFTLVAISESGKSASKAIHFIYEIPKPAEPVKTFGIESIRTFPEGNLLLTPGDKIEFKVKAFPGSKMSVMNNVPLYEMPITETRGMPGIYQGVYEIKSTDSFSSMKIPVSIVDSTGQKVIKETKDSFSIMSPLAPNVAITKGRLAHLEYGLGDDRLGGAKVGYIDSLIPLKVIGKVGTHYKIQLAKTRTAYIPDEHVTLAPKGTFEPSALTGKWKVYGDSSFDYVNIELTSRLPYQSFQLMEPSRIVVDIFGATNNTNWITQLENTKEISDVNYEQVADDIFRVTIQLTHKQHWGHQVFFRGNTLVIKVKHQPADLSLNKLIIGIDAGHGGKNTGAIGPTGIEEKTLALALSLKLQKTLEAQGAKVIMTRTTETFFDNKERILFYRDSLPDILISIHLNSSGDPFRAAGTATFYRYPGFKALNTPIHEQMLKLGLTDYGNNSSFNFMLNSPTEYPNALIETLFLSNPEEEMKMLDEGFQQEMTEGIVVGIKNFLISCKEH